MVPGESGLVRRSIKWFRESTEWSGMSLGWSRGACSGPGGGGGGGSVEHG